MPVGSIFNNSDFSSLSKFFKLFPNKFFEEKDVEYRKLITSSNFHNLSIIKIATQQKMGWQNIHGMTKLSIIPFFTCNHPEGWLCGQFFYRIVSE